MNQWNTPKKGMRQEEDCKESSSSYKDKLLSSIEKRARRERELNNVFISYPQLEAESLLIKA
jgi:hypothetical protein